MPYSKSASRSPSFSKINKQIIGPSTRGNIFLVDFIFIHLDFGFLGVLLIICLNALTFSGDSTMSSMFIIFWVPYINRNAHLFILFLGAKLDESTCLESCFINSSWESICVFTVSWFSTGLESDVKEVLELYSLSESSIEFYAVAQDPSNTSDTADPVSYKSLIICVLPWQSAWLKHNTKGISKAKATEQTPNRVLLAR